MLVKIKLKNADDHVLVSDASYEHLTNNQYFKSIGVIENLRMHSAGYAVFAKNHPLKDGTYRNETIYLHKYIAEHHVEKPPHTKRLFVSFKNGNPLDCTLENLEWISMADLRRNQKYTRSKSGYRGVTFDRNGYRAFIYDGKKRYELGIYSNPEEAAFAYNKKSIELFGKTKGLNVISKPRIGVKMKTTPEMVNA